MNSRQSKIEALDRLQVALERCQEEALRSNDLGRARRALMLWIRANDRAEILAEDPDALMTLRLVSGGGNATEAKAEEAAGRVSRKSGGKFRDTMCSEGRLRRISGLTTSGET